MMKGMLTYLFKVFLRFLMLSDLIILSLNLLSEHLNLMLHLACAPLVRCQLFLFQLDFLLQDVVQMAN